MTELREGNLHWQIMQDIMQGFNTDLPVTEISDSILSTIRAKVGEIKNPYDPGGDLLCWNGFEQGRTAFLELLK